MPFSLEGTVFESSIKVSRQLELEFHQLTIESSWEIAVKWLWQFSELLLNEDSFSLNLISDMR